MPAQWLMTQLTSQKRAISSLSEVLERNYYILLQTEKAATGTGSSSYPT